MAKTFYSVTVAYFGSNRPRLRWFRDKESALSFYHAGDFRDYPVRHTFRNADRIAEIERLIAAEERERDERQREHEYNCIA